MEEVPRVGAWGGVLSPASRRLHHRVRGGGGGGSNASPSRPPHPEDGGGAESLSLLSWLLFLVTRPHPEAIQRLTKVTSLE